MTAGERLQNQRPHGDDHPEHNPEEHLVAQVPHQDEEADSIKEARVMASAAAKVSEDFPNKDAEILRLIEERRSTPKEEKQRLKDLSKCIKKCIREKMKRQQDIQRIGVRNISQESHQQRRKYSSQR